MFWQKKAQQATTTIDSKYDNAIANICRDAAYMHGLSLKHEAVLYAIVQRYAGRKVDWNDVKNELHIRDLKFTQAAANAINMALNQSVCYSENIKFSDM